MPARPSNSMLQTWSALLAVSLGIFTITLDGSMMPVAIGSIVNDLNTQVSFVQAAMALHSLVMASTYLAAGKLALKFGEKRILVTGALIFAAGVIVAALSPNIWFLLLGWSIIKPLGGALMIPAASALIVLNYEGRQRTSAFGIFSAFVAAAAVLGPVWMGGVANLVGWRWAFGSEPLLIVLLLFFASMVKETDRQQKVTFDGFGALLSFVGLALLVLGATLAGELGWWEARRHFSIGGVLIEPFGFSAAVVFMSCGFIMLLVYAIWAEWRSKRGLAPLFHMRVFSNRNFSIGAVVGFCFQLVVGGLLFILPVFLQSVLYLDALQTGLTLLPYTMGIFIFTLGASRLPPAISAVLVVRTGLIVMIIGGWWVYQSASLSLNLSSLVPALFCFGAGAGMVLARLTELTLSEVEPNQLGEATGGDSTGKELGVAFGVSVIGSIFLALMFSRVVDGYFEFHHETGITREEHQQAVIELEDWAASITNDQWKAFLDKLPDTTGNAYEAIVSNAYLSAYQDALQILLGATVLMVFVSFAFAKRPQA